MRFSSLSIANFRAIKQFQVSNLTDFILIAGPNGCGKSCVFDALRLLKSTYGGYSANEVMQWFGEFQINLTQRETVRTLFRNPQQSIEISAKMELAAEEQEFLRDNAAKLVEPIAWRALLGAQYEEYRHQQAALATIHREHRGAIDAEILERSRILIQETEWSSHDLSLTVQVDGRLESGDSTVAEVMFQTYEPLRLGIIDYHSANRNYAREASGGVNVTLQDQSQSRRDVSLYNIQSKYSNVKTELAAAYVRDLVARDAGVQGRNISNLNETLQELFTVFFPDKSYAGVRPDVSGGLTFPVTTTDGATHDINDLSSGEKEVLYGYLRLRSSTPHRSIILLDEPELHLNPALLRGFPDFYHRNIGRALGNQLWLVTHSDTLLRQAVGNANFSVFHMAPATALDAEQENQASEVFAEDGLDSAIVSLVGDLASYRPNAKVAIFEGGGDSDFDVSVVTRLFPDFARRVNCVSGGNKSRVRDLYEVLAATAKQAGLTDKFYAVVDRDSEVDRERPPGTHSLSWDSYHIENYFLEPAYLRAAVYTLRGQDIFATTGSVEAALRQCASEVLGGIVMERLRQELNVQIRQAVNLGGKPGDADPATAIMPALSGTFARLESIKSKLDLTELQKLSEVHQRRLEGSLRDGSWRREMPGREILKRFVHHHLDGRAEYTAFMGVVLDKMADGSFQPQGMKDVIAAIMEGRDARDAPGGVTRT